MCLWLVQACCCVSVECRSTFTPITSSGHYIISNMMLLLLIRRRIKYREVCRLALGHGHVTFTKCKHKIYSTFFCLLKNFDIFFQISVWNLVWIITEYYISLKAYFRRLGVTSVWLDFLPSVLWHRWLGSRKSIQPIKKQGWGVGMVICLEQGADLHVSQLMPLPLTVSCFSKI